MGIVFDRQVGSAADVKELEYISALHQTDMDDGIRIDGSIRAEDISVFLLSRFGIVVSEEEVQEQLLSGLGGGNSGDECIDLMEVVAILLIPTILKASKLEMELSSSSSSSSSSKKKKIVSLSDKYQKPDPHLLQKTLSMMLEDATGDSEPKTLNKDLLCKIFSTYGETDLADDEDLHEEMIQAAAVTATSSAWPTTTTTTKTTTGTKEECFNDGDDDGDDNNDDAETGLNNNNKTQLDLKTFAKCLTYDVQDYDLKNEIRNTTHYEDVMLTRGGKEITHKSQLALEEEDQQEIIEGEERSSRQLPSPSRLSLTDVTQQKAKAAKLWHRYTAPAIDSTAGNYRSKTLTTLLWMTGILSYFAYWFNPQFFKESDTTCPEYEIGPSTTHPWITNSEAIACETFLSILKWFGRFTLFSLFGIFYVGAGSLGNGVEDKQVWKPLVGILVVCIFAIAPYVGDDGAGGGFLNVFCLLFGIAICVLHLVNFLTMCINPKFQKRYPILKILLWPSSLRDRKELKQAGQKKLCDMTSNALDIHKDRHRGVRGKHFGRALDQFALKGKETESVGGFRWTWSSIFDRSIHREHGLWYSNRLISSNLAQFIISFYVLSYGIKLTKHVVSNFNSSTSKSFVQEVSDYVVSTSVSDDVISALLANFTYALGSYVGGENAEFLNCSEIAEEVGIGSRLGSICSFVDSVTLNGTQDVERQLELLAAAGFDAAGLKASASVALATAAETPVDSLYPAESYMVLWPMAIATVAAYLTALYLSVIFIPSITSTMLKLRSGVIPTLRAKDFKRYRVAADNVSVLTGSMFWGSVISSIMVGGIVGFVVFLFVWQASIYFVQRVVAFCIGILSIALLKICLLQCCRCAMYKAFYRKRPFPANVTLLGLEWANFTLSVFFVVVRVVKLTLTAGFYIGRIDTPFVAKGVGDIANFELDGCPNIYLKDLLSHDAHRHPYIETLGTMYLMKLRYPDHFGKRAGSAWRLLFVYSLMPWMHKYRIHVSPNPEMIRVLSEEDETRLLHSENGTTGEVDEKALHRLAKRIREVLNPRKKESDEKNDGGDDGGEKMNESLLLVEKVLQEKDKEVQLAKQKSTKLELENEALRNQIASWASESQVFVSADVGGKPSKEEIDASKPTAADRSPSFGC